MIVLVEKAPELIWGSRYTWLQCGSIDRAFSQVNYWLGTLTRTSLSDMYNEFLFLPHIFLMPLLAS